ncbi:MAG TPA: ABC transporter permease [Blastocatellia bacterium]|nr:ABC transporter permease [Blastocatellia bacterium]
MDSLVVSNIFHRKTRTAASMAGVGLGVVLIVLTVGLVRGFLLEQGRRNSAVTAEIMFRPPGVAFGLNLAASPTMDVGYVSQLESIDGVRAAVPVAQFLRTGRTIDGVDFESFRKVSDARIVEGRPIRSGDEVIIDRSSQRSRKLKVGDKIDMFDHKFEVVGIYEPESLARSKIPLETLQLYTHSPGLCSMILVKVDDPAKQDEVAARIKEKFPDNAIWLTKQLPILYSRGTPALNTFLNIVVALSVIISALVILLAMYTTVTERTRQIGILRSLGASRLWVAIEIEKEALLISLIGVAAGFVISVAGKLVLENTVSLNIELEPIWFFYSGLIGLASSCFGALYPALRAANQDPVTALAYE